MKIAGVKYLGDKDYTFTRNDLICVYKHNADNGYPSITFKSPRGAAVHLWHESSALAVEVNDEFMGYVLDTVKMKNAKLRLIVEAGIIAWTLEAEAIAKADAEARADALKAL